MGFIFADGNINDFNKDRHYRLRIHLKQSDFDILEKIKNEMKFGGEVIFRTLKSSDISRNGYEICCLEISSKKMILDLVSHGCTPNKTGTCRYPIINKDLDRFFIRGYIDANGGLYYKRGILRVKSDFQMSISSGSIFILEEIIEKLVSNIPEVTSLGFRHSDKKAEYCKSGNQALLICSWIYKDSLIHLDRKFSIYKEIANMPS